MSDLTDLEICKRIAEIDGFTQFRVNDNSCYETPMFQVYCNNHYWDDYNLMEDDTLFFEWVEQVRPLITPRHDGIWIVRIWENESPIGSGVNKNLKRALYLAIIEAYKGDGNE